MQTKKHSLIEACSNTAIGFVISYASTFLIFPLVGLQSSSGKNLLITIFFTVISILRGYFIRRYFNGKIVRLNTTKKPFKLFCYQCEIEMPVQKDNKGLVCSCCKLRHWGQ